MTTHTGVTPQHTYNIMKPFSCIQVYTPEQEPAFPSAMTLSSHMFTLPLGVGCGKGTSQIHGIIQQRSNATLPHYKYCTIVKCEFINL